MRTGRRAPDHPALFQILAEHGVSCVVTGSGAALLHGVELAPGAKRVRALGPVALVASVADQLATLTVARREKDRPRVEALRQRQRG